LFQGENKNAAMLKRALIYPRIKKMPTCKKEREYLFCIATLAKIKSTLFNEN
jgi:hypothetical protein